MEFGILGPLRVVDGDRDVTPRRAKVKALLTTLLLNRNDVVPSDRLVEALWGESPPPTALTALHGHVSALRKLLGSERIETHPPGYRLWVEEGELDASEFQSLITRAGRLEHPAERAKLLQDALDLWRGEPLAEVRYESFAQNEIVRLDEVRLAALEDRIQADIQVGRHKDLVAELEVLLRDHPLRERLRAHLMLALYRSGRAADALHTFQEGRKVLALELGIDPGPALQRLHDQILRQDPSLGIPAAEAEATSRQEPDEAVAIEPVDERKLVTILFAEASSSEPTERDVDPERLRALTVDYIKAMADVIAVWGGTLQRYAGQTIMAVFGVPSIREDDAERAVRAALEMLERIQALNRDFIRRHGVALNLRIGIDTGEVIVSGRGTGEELLMQGDAVKTSARLEQSAENDTILVGDRTYMMTRHSLWFDEPFTIDLNGAGLTLAHPARGTRPYPTQVGLRFESPFVGRHLEIARLAGTLDEVINSNTPHVLLVYGSAGIGKSRLVREFVVTVGRRHAGLSVLTGRCLPAGRGVTYWALGEIMRDVFGIALDDAVDSAGMRLRDGATRLLGILDLSREELERTMFALAITAGIQLPENPLNQTEPRAVADEIGRAWPRLATALAKRQPTVLLIEDLHWAGVSLIQLLEKLGGRAEGPLLVVATARPEFFEEHPGFAAGREATTTISLEPLSRSEASSLVANVLPSGDLPEELLTKILHMAEGNPFFLEEILLQLIDSGEIAREGDRWRASPRTSPISLPDTVHGVLAARIDSLPAIEKRLLQEAAVIGRVFWASSLARIMPEHAIRMALHGLEDRGLIKPRPTSSISGHAEFQFKHALVREVAYTGLSKARRARAHAECALWVEELAGGRLDEFAEVVAHHYRLAVAGEDADLAWAEDPSEYERLRARAFEVLVRAGFLARRRFAIQKALELHDQALGLATDDLQRAGALSEIGDDHEANWHGDEALHAYREALDLVRKRPDAATLRARICLAATRMAAVKWGIFRSEPTPTEVETLINEGFEVATDQETRNWLMILRGTLGLRWLWWQYEPGKPDLKDPLPLTERIRFAEEGVAMANTLDKPLLLSLGYRTLGLLYSLAGSWSETVKIARRDLLLAERLPPSERAFALFFNAIFLMEIEGEYGPSLPHGERSLETARALTRHELMHGTYTVMSARYHLGQWDGLEALASEHAVALAQEQGIGCPYSRGGPAVAAIALAHQGRFDRATELAGLLIPKLERPGLPEALLARYLVAKGEAEKGLELAERILGRSVYAEENAFEVLATLEALVALEKWGELIDFLPKAREYSAGLAIIEPTADRAEGMALAAGGDLVAAEDLFGRALTSFDRIGIVFESALTKEQLAGIVGGDEAVFLRGEALSTYERLGAAPHAARLRAKL